MSTETKKITFKIIGMVLFLLFVFFVAKKPFLSKPQEISPEVGFQSKITLGESIIKLVQNGVIEPLKVEELYAKQDGLPSEFKNIFNNPLSKPILLTRQNANIYLNILWPIGLSNYIEINEKSPLKGESLFNFASTAGWTLGKEKNGGIYFNKFEIINLSPQQEEKVLRIAKTIFRPCCNNHTFFQDCNHGSALLGLLELGASQGLDETELYKEALAFNSFWFPKHYLEIATYFRVRQGVGWDKINPKIVLSRDFSSANGQAKIAKEIKKLKVLPEFQEAGTCGV